MNGSKTHYVVIYKVFCLDVAQGHMNGHPIILELPREDLLV